MLAAYLKGGKERFGKEMELAFGLSGTRTGKLRWNFRSRPYGVSGYSEGAGYHCQPLARELTEQRMLDWMDERIADVGK